MGTKTVTVATNWLDRVDGYTVAEAIEYLQTLDPSHTLDCYLEGDTHGCDIVARLTYKVPLTDDEEYEQLEKHYTKKIAYYTTARDAHVRDGRTARVDSCNIRIDELVAKFDAIKAKYNK